MNSRVFQPFDWRPYLPRMMLLAFAALCAVQSLAGFTELPLQLPRPEQGFAPDWFGVGDLLNLPQGFLARIAF